MGFINLLDNTISAENRSRRVAVLVCVGIVCGIAGGLLGYSLAPHISNLIFGKVLNFSLVLGGILGASSFGLVGILVTVGMFTGVIPVMGIMRWVLVLFGIYVSVNVLAWLFQTS